MPVRSLMLFCIALFLGACGPRHSGSPAASRGVHTDTTGYEKETKDGKRAYTLAGNPEVYDELHSSFKGKSPAMARSIEKVRVKKLKGDDKYRVTADFNGRYFRLEEVKFEGKLNTTGTEKYGLFLKPDVLPENFKSNFSLKIRCRSVDCQLMEMTLVEKAGNYFEAEAVWIYQERQTNTKFVESSDGGIEDLKLDAENSESVQTSVVVVEGPSYSEVTVKAKGAKEQDEPILVITTDLVSTQERAENVQSVKLRGDTKVTAALEGNDPETGDLMLEIEREDGGGSVRVIVEGPQADNRGPQRIHLGVGERSLDPSGISPEIDKYTQALNNYSSNPEIEKRIELWLSKEGGRACSGCRALSRGHATKFLTNLQAVIPELLEASHVTGTSPEKAYLLAIESAFLTSKNFPIQVSRVSNSSASGPWQLQTGTAQEAIDKGSLPFQVFDLSNKRLNPNDDRNYFYESTVMALQYFSTFPSGLKHDPGLQLAGYYQGPYGLNRFVKRHGKSNMSFADLAKFNAFDNPKDTADYVYSAFSLRFVGMNSEVHNLEIPALEEVPAALQSKLRNPKRK